MLIRTRVALVASLVAALVLSTAQVIVSSADASTPMPVPAVQVGLTVVSMTTDSRVDPVGIDTPQPRLAWILTSSTRSQVQSAYRIQVATSPQALDDGTTDVWDSGKVASAQSTGVGYGGPALASGTRYFWRVMTWDGAGAASQWSPVAFWETGLLDSADWNGAQWIGRPQQSTLDLQGAHWIWYPEGNPASSEPVSTRYFRRSFDVADISSVSQARVVLTGDDTADLWVNGQQLSSSPRVTDAWKQAAVVDVTGALRSGGNVLAVASTNATVSPAGMIAKLRITHTDGSTTDIVTDGSWKASQDGPSGWQHPSYDDSAWPAALDVAPYGQGPWGSNVNVNGQRGGSYLRGSLTLPSTPVWARAYASGRGNYERGPDGQGICCEQAFGLARGIFETYINGKRVGDLQMETAAVDTRIRALYRTYDVANLLHAGDNVVGAQIGEDSDVIIQIVAKLADGRVVRWGTDGTWMSAPGPVRAAHRYHGETYDARAEVPGWDTTAFDATGWAHVRTTSEVGTMTAAAFEPMRVVATRHPVGVTTPATGVYVFDFGTNLTGWTQLSAELPAGTTVTLKHGERLTNGRVDNSIIVARQTSTYTSAGGQVTWEPSFAYAGFRWVEVTGLPSAPGPDTVLAREVHNDVPRTGSFTSSDTLLAQLHAANVQTELNGLHGIQEDTPTREKRGWMADAHISAPAYVSNFGMDAFYSNFVQLMADAQQPNGQVPDIVPVEPTASWQNRSDPAWAVATVLIPNDLYTSYGDDQVLRDHYASMQRWMDYVATTTDGYLITRPSTTWGNDWVAIESTDGTLFRSTFYFWAARLMARDAEVLGRAADKVRYDELASNVRRAVNARFFDAGAATYGSSQFADAFPLLVGVVPAGRAGDVLESLVAKVHARGDHFTGGLPGIKYIPEALAAYGRSDLVLKVLRKTDYPSWGYMLEHGPGTIWESWNGDSSLDHPMFTSIDSWLYSHVAGIQQSENSTGYRNLVFDPAVTAGMDSASGTVTTPYGEASSTWKKVDGRVVLDVTVPVNATAEVHLPATSTWALVEGGSVNDGGWFAAEATGVKSVTLADGDAVAAIGSGTYRFTTDELLGQLGEARATAASTGADLERLAASGEVSPKARDALANPLTKVSSDIRAALDAYRAGNTVDLRTWLESAQRDLASFTRAVDRQRVGGALTQHAADVLNSDAAVIAGYVSGVVSGLVGVSVSTILSNPSPMPGQRITATVTLRNSGAETLVKPGVTVSSPAGWQADVGTVVPTGPVEPGQQASFPVTLTVPQTQPLGPVSFPATLTYQQNGAPQRLGFNIGMTVVSPIVFDSLLVDPRVVAAVGDQAAIVAVLRNVNPDVAATVDVTATQVPSGWTAGTAKSVTVPAGSTERVEIPLTAGASPGGKVVLEVQASGQVFATAETAAYLRGSGCSADPTGEACLPSGFRLLYNFENGTEGWKAGANVDSVESVTSFANGPQSAWFGTGAMDAASAPNVPASAWRTVSVTPSAPIGIGDAQSLVVYIDGYGGAGDASVVYEARITATSSDGTPLTQTQRIMPDQWNRVRLDLRGWAATDIASIEVSFHAQSANNWQPHFQVDLVGLDSTPDQAGNLASGASVTARSTLNGGAWGTARAVDGVRESTAASMGYTSDPWQLSPNAVEWLSLDLGGSRAVGSVWLYPRTATGTEPLGNGGAGFPEEFQIETSANGADWATVRRVTAQYSDGSSGVGYSFTPTTARYVRLYVTKLGRPAADEAVNGYYRLQLAEVEVYGG